MSPPPTGDIQTASLHSNVEGDSVSGNGAEPIRGSQQIMDTVRVSPRAEGQWTPGSEGIRLWEEFKYRRPLLHV
ncbi:hypothetical protein EYF80_049017 [Liparis tanakae]|uniref:Uncharacterized protein n=1 Tax=Liparis tanakae TaxID=230148 RepID=A0A4Z2FJ51_9TELE|nr:hypothetical protein EYF80_049017 [Liparis tanakae]